MPRSEAEIVEKYLRGADRYLELGAGGSTLLAMKLGVPKITAIDSDAVLLEVIGNKFLSLRVDPTQEFHSRHVSTSHIGPWGYPLGGKSDQFLKNYLDNIRSALPADVVLIDGRFRLAAFLEVAKRADGPVTILWDDYKDREGYHAVESLITPSTVHGRVAVFELTKRLVAPPKLLRLASKMPA